MLLDNLEYISVRNQTTDFPKHFHETFCISLIHKGIEQISFEEQTLIGETGSITITNPYEIHSNPIIDTSLQLEFDTIYIAVDLMKYLCGGKTIAFANRKINDPRANKLFIQLKNALDQNKAVVIEQLLFQFAQVLVHYSKEKKEAYSVLKFNSLNRVNEFIENNIQSKFNLDALSKMVHLNKFGFAKKFKTTTGMSTMNYIMMRKIFSSKKLITQHSGLTKIAYDYEFVDMAHYSKTFKKYVGVSPKTYQQKLLLNL